MPLPTELDRKIRDRFDELISDAESLLVDEDPFDPNSDSIYQEWIEKTVGLIQLLFGNSPQSEDYRKIFEKISATLHVGGTPIKYLSTSDLRKKVARLKGIRNNYINGFYDSLEDLIVANVSADYMAQAQSLLAEGVAGQYDHVPAAVLCGAVLENRLRTYCDNHKPPIPTQKPNGDYKTLGPLIAELDKVKAFDRQTRNMLRSWADIRNWAAHGNFDKFSREQVELMLMGVNQFLANQL